MSYTGFTYFDYFTGFLILSVFVGVLFISLIVPTIYGTKAKKRRIFRATFKKDVTISMPDNVEPLVFTTQKWYFAIVVYLLVVVAFIPLYVTTSFTNLFYTNGLVMVSVLVVILLITGVVFILINQYWAVLYIFPDRVILKSVFKTKAYYYKNLDCLRLGTVYTRQANYDTYEFWQNDKRVLRLSILVFKNISFLEEVFSAASPCVLTVLNKNL